MPDWLIFVLGIWTGTLVAVPLLAWFSHGGEE